MEVVGGGGDDGGGEYFTWWVYDRRGLRGTNATSSRSRETQICIKGEELFFGNNTKYVEKDWQYFSKCLPYWKHFLKTNNKHTKNGQICKCN